MNLHLLTCGFFLFLLSSLPDFLVFYLTTFPCFFFLIIDPSTTLRHALFMLCNDSVDDASVYLIRFTCSTPTTLFPLFYLPLPPPLLRSTMALLAWAMNMDMD